MFTPHCWDLLTMELVCNLLISPSSNLTKIKFTLNLYLMWKYISQTISNCQFQFHRKQCSLSGVGETRHNTTQGYLEKTRLGSTVGNIALKSPPIFKAQIFSAITFVLVMHFIRLLCLNFLIGAIFDSSLSFLAL